MVIPKPQANAKPRGEGESPSDSDIAMDRGAQRTTGMRAAKVPTLTAAPTRSPGEPPTATCTPGT
eukprot:scaffold50695_cov69-Phaeocystis_antarctica.AAC.4